MTSSPFGSNFRECWLLGSDKVGIGHAVTNEPCSSYCLDRKMLFPHWMSMLLFIILLGTKSCDFFLNLTITMFERQFSFCGFFFPYPFLVSSAAKDFIFLYLFDTLLSNGF